MRKYLKHKAFTLVELLVVVSIISFLSSIVLSTLNSTRGKARDARRLQDVNQLKIAFNSYYADYGSFPLVANDTFCLGLDNGSTCWEGYIPNDLIPHSIYGNTSLKTALAPYISTISADPDSTRTIGDRYIYSAGAANLHCSTAVAGPYIVWQPETIGPTSDKSCGAGSFACCGPVFCAPKHFCVLKI